MTSRVIPVPPAWGWKAPYAGRAAHVTAAPEYQATTTQVCGLFPYVAGCGTPAVGTPVGRHQLFGEVVCLDPLAWLRAGLTVNPGEFILGQPGTGKSTLAKRQITGAVATGTRAIILGDTKPDYTLLTGHLGGQVICVGRGLDRINPLDSGPLGDALRRMSGADAQALRWEVRSRRLSLLMALCTLVREARITNAEEVVLGRTVDLLDERNRSVQPTVADVLAGTIMVTHSLADLDALATETDRAKARGFVERCAITVMGGLPPRELARVHEITPLTRPEQELVTSWSAPDSWQPGARHPGRGKYLIKTGERLGIPVELSLVGAEHALYDTDQAIRASQPGA
jgi:hypothetical protein